MKIKKVIRVGVLTGILLSICVMLHAVSLVLADDTNNLFLESDEYGMSDKIAHFNGIVFNNYEAYKADIEGALAVGSIGKKDTKAIFGSGGGFDLGASYDFKPTAQIGNYTNKFKFPTLMVDNQGISVGPVSGDDSSHYSVYGGDLILSNSTYNKYKDLPRKFSVSLNGAAQRTVQDEMVQEWFGEVYNLICAGQQQYIEAGELNKSTMTWNEYMTQINKDTNPEEYQNTYLASGNEVDDKVLVLNIETGNSLNLGTDPKSNVLHVPYSWLKSDYEVIILNFPDVVNVTGNSTEPYIDGFNVWNWNTTTAWDSTYITNKEIRELRELMGSKVVYSFPNAKSITLSKAFICGTIMAPNSYVKGDGGSINGQLIADSFDQMGQMELHALRINRRAYEVMDDPIPVGNISVWKYGEDGNNLSGAKFVLKKKNAEGEEWYADLDQESDFEYLFVDFVKSTDASEEKYVFGTNRNGRVDINNLPVTEEGEQYVLKEVEAPEGYRINDNPDDKGKDSYYEHTFELEESEELRINRVNYKNTGELYLKKISSEDNEKALSGAEFELYTYTGEHGNHQNSTLIKKEIFSDKEGMIHLTEIEEGRYCLYEVNSPAGYELIDNGHYLFDFTFENGAWKIKQEMKEGIHGQSLGSKDNPLIIENQPGQNNWSGSIRIMKYHLDGKQYLGLEGAVFELYILDGSVWKKVEEDSDGAHIGPQFTTGKDGIVEISNLAEGEYRVVEVKAPKGYKIDEESLTNSDNFRDEKNDLINGGYYVEEVSLKEKADEADLISSVTVYVSNLPHTADIQILKLGGDPGSTDRTIGIPMQGITFGVARIDNNSTFLEVYELQTDKDGVISVKGLSAGTYTIWESILDDTPNYKKLEGQIFFDLVFDEKGNPEIKNVRLAEELKGEGTEIDEGTYPVSVDNKEGIFEFTVFNELLTTGIKVIKYDKDIYQLGLDESGQYDKEIIIKYLEGAEFQLYRNDIGFSAPFETTYGEPFKSKLDESEVDFYGNPMAVATIDGLPYGYYMIEETKIPEGYRTNSKDGIVGYFAITEDMVSDQSKYFYYEVTNELDVNRGDIKVSKKDDEGEAVAGHAIPFKLWEITSGAEEWEEDVTIEEALVGIYNGDVEFYKRVNPESEQAQPSTTFWTNEAGVLTLRDIPEGVYVLFEHLDETDEAFLEKYLYTLNDGKHTIVHDIEEFEPAFYYHATLFKVVAAGDDDVKIAWIDRHKLWSGQATFNSEDGNELTVVNKRKENLEAYIRFEKTDAESREKLKDAEFGLYKKTNLKNSVNGNLDDYKLVQETKSDKDGIVAFKDPITVDLEWVGDPANHLMYTRYMIKEMNPPAGYVSSDEAIYVRLELDPETKMINIFRENSNGNKYPGLDGLYGYDASRSEVQGFDETRFMTEFDITELIQGRFANYKESTVTGDVTIRKVDSANRDKVIGNATFRLQTWDAQNKKWEYYNGPFTTSTSSGTTTIHQLPEGKYKIIEVVAPVGYVLSDVEIEFTLRINANKEMEMTSNHKWVDEESFFIEYENEPIPPMAITIFKTDASGEDKLMLPGAEFLLEIWNDAASSYEEYDTGVSDAKGLIIWDNLYEGKYRASEVNAPDGYSIPVGNSNYITFEVVKTDDGDELEIIFPYIQTIPNPNAVTVVEKDKLDQYEYLGEIGDPDVLAIVRNEQYKEPFAHIQLKKQDDRERPVTGAQFLLEVLENGVWQSVGGPRDTGREGDLRWDGLDPGYYRLTEVKVPEGYTQVEGETQIEFSLVVDESGKTMDMVMKDSSGFLASDNGEYFTAGNDGQGHNIFGFKALNIRTYDGYFIGEITIGKESAEEGEEGTPLAQTTFALSKYNKEVNVDKITKELVDSIDETEWVPYPDEQENIYVTGENGTVTITGLTAGLYKVDEIIPPEGYALYGDGGDTIYFLMVDDYDEEDAELADVADVYGNHIESDDGSNDVSLRFADKRLQPIDITVIKKDEADGSLLENVEFDLYRMDKDSGKYVRYNKSSLVTDKNGKIQLDQIGYGKYMLEETKVPEGYHLPEGEAARTYFELISNPAYTGLVLTINNIEVDAIEITNAKDSVLLMKVDEKDPTIRLAGAEFMLEKLIESEEETEEQTETEIETETETDLQSESKSSEIEDVGENVIVPMDDTPQQQEETSEGTGIEMEPETEAAPVPETASSADLVEEQPEDETEAVQEARFRFNFISSLFASETTDETEGLSQPEETWEVVKGYESFKTRADGKVYLKKLEEGTYRLTELTAPEGYTLEKEIVIVFTVNDDGTLNEIQDGDSLEKGSIVVTNKAEEKPPETNPPKDPKDPERPKETRETNPETDDETGSPRSGGKQNKPGGSSKKKAAPLTGDQSQSGIFLLITLLSAATLFLALKKYRVKGRIK